MLLLLLFLFFSLFFHPLWSLHLSWFRQVWRPPSLLPTWWGGVSSCVSFCPPSLPSSSSSWPPFGASRPFGICFSSAFAFSFALRPFFSDSFPSFPSLVFLLFLSFSSFLPSFFFTLDFSQVYPASTFFSFYLVPLGFRSFDLSFDVFTVLWCSLIFVCSLWCFWLNPLIFFALYFFLWCFCISFDLKKHLWFFPLWLFYFDFVSFDFSLNLNLPFLWFMIWIFKSPLIFSFFRIPLLFLLIFLLSHFLGFYTAVIFFKDFFQWIHTFILCVIFYSFSTLCHFFKIYVY